MHGVNHTGNVGSPRTLEKRTKRRRTHKAEERVEWRWRAKLNKEDFQAVDIEAIAKQIGRASCRERV